MTKKGGSFSASDRIAHTVFGLGTISEANERYTTIVFDEGGTRKFLTSMVRLDRSSTPAPPKPTRKKKAKVARAKAKPKAKAKAKTTAKAKAKPKAAKAKRK